MTTTHPSLASAIAQGYQDLADEDEPEHCPATWGESGDMNAPDERIIPAPGAKPAGAGEE